MRLLVPILFLFSSCIIIPTPAHRDAGRIFIKPEMIQFVKPDTTTRAEVLLRLGEPDGVAFAEKVLIYHWTAVYGYVVAGGYHGGPASAASLDQQQFCLVGFNENNTVKKIEVIRHNIDRGNIELAQFAYSWYKDERIK